MKKVFIPLMIVIFIVIGIIVWGASQLYAPLDLMALMAGNALMALLSISSFLMVKKQMDARPQAFVRGVSGASFLKLIVCGGAILGYALAKKPDVDKPTLLTFFGIYMIYTVAETVLLSRMAKNNAVGNK